MTAQINDKVFYRQQEYDMAGVNGTGLFTPQEYGMRPARLSTACWRGYHCGYDLADGLLRLMDLTIALQERGPAADEQAKEEKSLSIL
jgi:hypothetical protein